MGEEYGGFLNKSNSSNWNLVYALAVALASAFLFSKLTHSYRWGLFIFFPIYLLSMISLTLEDIKKILQK